MKPSFRNFAPNRALRTLVGLAVLSLLNPSLASAQVDATFNFSPPTMDAPGNREPGGQRTDVCIDTTENGQLTALVPRSNIGLTTQASPDLLAYVPTNNAERAELRILEEATSEEIYVGEITLPVNLSSTSDYRYLATIVSIPLSSESIVLEPGKNYIWALFLVCDGDNRANDIGVDVVVRRVGDAYRNSLAPDIAQALDTIETANSQEKLSTFGRAGLWHDFLAEMLPLSRQSPAIYSDDWRRVLTEQGLPTLIDVPVFESELIPLTF